MTDRDLLLRTIAETGYNVIFGAKKTFATFDIVGKVPGWIGFGSFIIGTFALFTESLAEKVPSALLLIAGVAALYFATYPTSEYEAAGKKLIGLHNRLRDLYRAVQGGGDIASARSELSQIESEYYTITVSRQIFLSDWYAHFKLFAQSQYGWMDEQLKFTWKDKIPLTARIVAVAMILAVVLLLAAYGLQTVVCPTGVDASRGAISKPVQ